MTDATLPTPPSDRPTWGIADIFLGVALYALPLLALIVLQFLGVRLRLPLPADALPVVQAALLVVVEALLIVPVWLVAVVKARSTWQVVGFRRASILQGCGLPILYLFVALVAGGVWGAAIQVMNWPTQQEIVPLFENSPAAIALGFIGIVLAAPIGEEAFFRGFIIGGLRKRFGARGALLISAAGFALLHPPITIFPVIFVLGFLLGLLFLQTKSLWPGIFMHIFFNTLGFVGQYLR
ncbi:MAG: CPBP family intramembrane metalloprotease [Chloroflexi bacterium]|nr:CPBP family intramembrane metalloprotease [Chloroflexota bacterium]